MYIYIYIYIYIYSTKKLDQIENKMQMGSFLRIAAFYALLVVFIVLSMNSWSLMVEARIPDFSAIQGTKISPYLPLPLPLPPSLSLSKY